jgi:hypothetical protein
MKKVYPYALISFILGVVSFIQLLGLERAIPAVIFGVIALKKMNAEGVTEGKRYAYAGITLGIIYLIVLTIIMIFKGSVILNILGGK